MEEGFTTFPVGTVMDSQSSSKQWKKIETNRILWRYDIKVVNQFYISAMQQFFNFFFFLYFDFHFSA